jgi:alcohol dehydrogenase YqhD (iron-dependent ADH family)
VQYAIRVWGVDSVYDDPKKIALEGIRRTEDFFRGMGLPVGLKALNVGEISDAVIDELAEKCVFFGRRSIGAFKVLKKEDIIKIYKAARDEY